MNQVLPKRHLPSDAEPPSKRSFQPSSEKTPMKLFYHCCSECALPLEWATTTTFTFLTPWTHDLEQVCLRCLVTGLTFN